MTYKHLTGRLIETQRSMIGDPAIRIARSIEGITVTDEGAVTAVDGDGYAVVAELAARYTDILGNAAQGRLVAAAEEFDGDVVLPPELGGPEDPDAVAGHESDGHAGAVGLAEADSAVRAASDGGTVAVPAGRSVGDDDDNGVSLSLSVSEPLTVDYTLASAIDAADYAETDLDSVYLLPSGGDGWQEPIAVTAAVVNAIATATGVPADRIPEPAAAIDQERLLPTLNGEHGETVSFGVGDLTVTFHRSGSLAVHE